MFDINRRASFERVTLPHLDAAYNLARWLTRNDHDAEDVVQDAFLRAFRFFDRFQGLSARAWLLKIVRNTCYTWLQKNRGFEFVPIDDEIVDEATCAGAGPELQLSREEDRQKLQQAMDGLPVELREALVLRDWEGLSYKEISAIAEIPMGTVMSRLARARERLLRSFGPQENKGGVT